MRWDAAPAGRSAGASPGRHRAPEPATVDELTDTVAISPHSWQYGRHAAHPTDLPKLTPAAGPTTVPADVDEAAPEPKTGAPCPGGRPSAGHLVSYLWPWTARRSA